MENISLKSIKWESVKSIFQAIASAEKTSRADISEQTGLSLMTVGKVADALLELDVVVQTRESRGSAGRRAGLLSVSPEHYAVILDLTCRDFRMTIMNMRMEVKEKQIHTFREHMTMEENLRQFLEGVRVYAALNLQSENCIGCGVSVPGPYFADKDRVFTSRMPALNDIPIGETVREYLSPSALYIEAGHNAAATSNISRIPNYREKLILYWFIAEGHICGTVVNHGEILRGAHNAAGNLGQIRVGRGRTLESAVRQDRPPEENAAELARAIRNVVTVVDPDIIILECELYRDSEAFIEQLRHALEENTALPPEMLPQFISAGCKFRHSHRGLTMKLREMWLADIVLGESL